jgi:hypothetical protein
MIFTQKTFNKKATEYLSRFKKDYTQRTIKENILVDCLYNIEFLGSNNLRYYGAAEAILIVETGLKLSYEEKDIKLFNVKVFTIKEHYTELILKKIKEYLKDRNIL